MFFKGSELPQIQVLNTCLHCLRQASTALGADALDDAAVHQTRKRLKRARAALRLLRPALTGQQYRTQMTAVRDAGRGLAEARDASVMRDVLDAVLEEVRQPSATAIRLRARLEHERRERNAALSTGDIRRLREQLADTLVAMAAQPTAVATTSQAVKELGRTYRKARRAMRSAACSRDATARHEWRKRAKCLEHQLAALDLAPRLRKRLACVTDSLGADRDYWLLGKRLGDDMTPEIASVLKRRRRHAQRDALAAGQRALWRRPRSFERRMRKRLQRQLRLQSAVASAP